MKSARNWGRLGMKCKLSDICSFRKGKVEVENLNAKNYISTENMLPNKCGITEASSLPTVSLTQEYKNGDVLVSNIRPYFKKIWQAQYDGGCSNDVLVFVPKPNTDKDFLYYVLADDDFFTYSMATSKGTKMPRGDKTSIMQYEVPLIDLQVQKKIASVLKALDEKIELNNKINHNFISQINTENIDDTKIKALTNAFVDSKVLMIYGAAGTGKTTLMDYISTMLDGCSKLFLTKTHTALENMKRRIKSPGFICEFMGIDSFNNSYAAADYDVIFIDECSTIDNKTMVKLLEKSGKESLLVLAGDIYQIESIDFGNWFFYAKEILPEKSIVELDNTWRTQEPTIKNLWEEVRFLQPIITEKLVIDGPFSKDIGKDIFDDRIEDEVVLCLNYDGKFGLNSINNYFQDANPSQKAYYWYEWKYKIGDPILFNENKRFPMLYNNLKGIITDIKEEINGLKFTIDIPIILTAVNVRGTDLEIISHTEKTTRISFSVCINDDNQTEEDYDEARMKSIIPFQLAYAVSIHKAQGLEYTSVKIVIPQSNSERITHGVFYTAITRTKKKLKIYWSANTMEDVISGFNEEKQSRISLDFIKGLISNN